MKGYKIFICFILVLVVFFQIGFGVETSVDLKSTQAVEQYVRIENALKKVGPKDVIQIVIVYSYEEKVAKEFYAADPLPERLNDREFYTSLFPYLLQQNKYFIFDDGNKNKHEILREISNKVSDKSIVLLFYAGHGDRDGSLMIGSYKNECKLIGNQFLSEHPQYETYSRPQLADIWSRNYEPNWGSHLCQPQNYILSPDELMKSGVFKNSRVVFVNDSCFSGTYNKYLGDPLSMVVYAAGKNETALTFNKTVTGSTFGIIKPGGFLTNLLKMRLGERDGCQLDGEMTGNRDLVLDIYEWTAGLNFPWKDLKHGTRTTGVEYNKRDFQLPIEDLQAVSIPVQVYTREQCGLSQAESAELWSSIGHQVSYYQKNMSEMGARYINQIFSGMMKTSKGDYSHPFNENTD